MKFYLLDNWLALTALFLSILNFIHTIYIGRRDAEKLVAKCRYTPEVYDNEDDSTTEPHLAIEAFNRGRRYIILRRLIMKYDDGEFSQTRIGDDADGVKLNEKERYFCELFKTFGNDGLYHPISKARAIDLCIEDSIGQQHKIEGAKKCLMLYFGDLDAQAKRLKGRNKLNIQAVLINEIADRYRIVLHVIVCNTSQNPIEVENVFFFTDESLEVEAGELQSNSLKPKLGSRNGFLEGGSSQVWETEFRRKPSFALHTKSNVTYGKGRVVLKSDNEIEFEFKMPPDGEWNLLEKENFGDAKPNTQ